MKRHMHARVQFIRDISRTRFVNRSSQKHRRVLEKQTVMLRVSTGQVFFVCFRCLSKMKGLLKRKGFPSDSLQLYIEGFSSMRKRT